MGIYIKGMKMPILSYREIRIYPDGHVTEEDECGIDEIVGVAKQVPPHGRLIDADALEDRCSRQAKDEWNKSTGTNWGYAYATFESDVEDAPTIIEVEEE